MSSTASHARFAAVFITYVLSVTMIGGSKATCAPSIARASPWLADSSVLGAAAPKITVIVAALKAAHPHFAVHAITASAVLVASFAVLASEKLPSTEVASDWYGLKVSSCVSCSVESGVGSVYEALWSFVGVIGGCCGGSVYTV